MVSLASSENTIRAGGNICWVGVDGSISDHYYPKAPGPDGYPLPDPDFFSYPNRTRKFFHNFSSG